MACLARASTFAGAAVRGRVVAKAARVSTAVVNRSLWLPGSEAPAHLDGTLAGDFGFDPLNLGTDKKALSWYVQAELQNGRWAMLGVAGILAQEAFQGLTAPGLPASVWTETGKVALPSWTNFGTLMTVTLICMGWAETKRYMDYLNPKSQGSEGYGLEAFFQGSGEPGYPGGPMFDPMGMAKGNLAELKLKELKNGRLAMMAFLGFIGQRASMGGSPLGDLAKHLADPLHNTVAVNHVALPFLDF